MVNSSSEEPLHADPPTSSHIVELYLDRHKRDASQTHAAQRVKPQDEKRRSMLTDTGVMACCSADGRSLSQERPALEIRNHAADVHADTHTLGKKPVLLPTVIYYM